MEVDTDNVWQRREDDQRAANEKKLKANPVVVLVDRLEFRSNEDIFIDDSFPHDKRSHHSGPCCFSRHGHSPDERGIPNGVRLDEPSTRSHPALIAANIPSALGWIETAIHVLVRRPLDARE